MRSIETDLINFPETVANIPRGIGANIGVKESFTLEPDHCVKHSSISGVC